MRSKYQLSETYTNAMLLTLSGGLQNAYAYCCRGKVFANAQTGNIVLMSKHLLERDMHGFARYLVPICAFILGTFITELIHKNYKKTNKLQWRQFILMFEISFLFIAGCIPHSLDMIASTLISFVCAMQVQAFRRMDGLSYASTMCIGNMRFATESLCTFFHTHEKSDLHTCLKASGITLLFAIGAGLGVFLTTHFDTAAIWMSCILLLLNFLTMFTKQNSLFLTLFS